MNTINNLDSNTFYDSIEISHLVYEKDDDGLMMACKIEKNNKKYYTNLSISFTQFNEIISKLLQCGIDIYDELAINLFQSNNFVSEVNLASINGKNIVLNDFSLLSNAA
jgi:hypothetical protein